MTTVNGSNGVIVGIVDILTPKCSPISFHIYLPTTKTAKKSFVDGECVNVLVSASVRLLAQRNRYLRSPESARLYVDESYNRKMG